MGKLIKSKLTRQQAEKLGQQITQILGDFYGEEGKAEGMTLLDDHLMIAYAGKLYIYSKGKVIETRDAKATDYCKHANNAGVTLFYDGGPLYNIVNGDYGWKSWERLEPQLNKAIEKFGAYWESCTSWCMTMAGNIRWDNGGKVEPVRMDGNSKDIPLELAFIQQWWTERANDYGDVGSCVIGAGMEFNYQDKAYFMPPLSKWQGSCSWEAFTDEVKAMLKVVGATDVYYNPGRMD